MAASERERIDAGVLLPLEDRAVELNSAHTAVRLHANQQGAAARVREGRDGLCDHLLELGVLDAALRGPHQGGLELDDRSLAGGDELRTLTSSQPGPRTGAVGTVGATRRTSFLSPSSIRSTSGMRLR